MITKLLAVVLSLATAALVGGMLGLLVQADAWAMRRNDQLYREGVAAGDPCKVALAIWNRRDMLDELPHSPLLEEVSPVHFRPASQEIHPSALNQRGQSAGKQWRVYGV